MHATDDPLSQEMRAMLSGIDLFRTAADRMRYLTQRQTVISRNIANADTPGYKAREVMPFTFNDALQQVGMTVTDPKHIVPASMAGANKATPRA